MHSALAAQSGPQSFLANHMAVKWPSPTHDVLSQTWKFTARHTLASRPNPESLILFLITHEFFIYLLPPLLHDIR